MGFNFDYKLNILKKIGKDGESRSSKFEVTWLLFSSSHVYMYKFIFDTTSDWEQELMEEYAYRDITSFSTVSWKDKYVNRTTTFKLTVSGADFSCSLLRDDETDRTISAMKQKLREKKG
jgi:hypothetical protein